MPVPSMASGLTLGLTYDYESQLTQITCSNGTPASSFLYNGDNVLVRRLGATVDRVMA